MWKFGKDKMMEAKIPCKRPQWGSFHANFHPRRLPALPQSFPLGILNKSKQHCNTPILSNDA